MRVRQVCDKYDLPYTTGSLLVQYGKAWRTIDKLSLPNKYLSDPADDAPETASRRCSPSSSRHSSGPTRQPARVEDRDGDGAAVAAA